MAQTWKILFATHQLHGENIFVGVRTRCKQSRQCSSLELDLSLYTPQDESQGHSNYIFFLGNLGGELWGVGTSVFFWSWLVIYFASFVRPEKLVYKSCLYFLFYSCPSLYLFICVYNFITIYPLIYVIHLFIFQYIYLHYVFTYSDIVLLAYISLIL